jgi:hypothetical protein
LHGVIEKYVLKNFTKGRFLEKGNAYMREHFFSKMLAFLNPPPPMILNGYYGKE